MISPAVLVFFGGRGTKMMEHTLLADELIHKVSIMFLVLKVAKEHFHAFKCNFLRSIGSVPQEDLMMCRL